MAGKLEDRFDAESSYVDGTDGFPASHSMSVSGLLSGALKLGNDDAKEKPVRSAIAARNAEPAEKPKPQPLVNPAEETAS
jgi:hypothetical protein